MGRGISITSHEFRIYLVDILYTFPHESSDLRCW